MTLLCGHSASQVSPLPMAVTLDHVLHYLDLSAQLERAAAAMPNRERMSGGPQAGGAPWRANLTRWELLRIFPALLRVEILEHGRPRSSASDKKAEEHRHLTQAWRRTCCTPMVAAARSNRIGTQPPISSLPQKDE